jgi:hypothetical protein
MMTTKSVSPTVLEYDTTGEPCAITIPMNTTGFDEVMTIILTNEGVLMDFYVNGELTGTICQTYSEWFDASQ